MKTKWFTASITIISCSWCATPLSKGDTYRYTTLNDFQAGSSINLNGSGDQLQINSWAQSKTASPPVMPYVWVPCSFRGTVVRIANADRYSIVDQRNVTIGEILGEYRTAPELCPAGACSSPSRTAVDFDGNVWVGNRSNVTVGDLVYGHAVKIGSGLAFQWIDRNCNGVLDTSRGLGDIRTWLSHKDHGRTSDEARRSSHPSENKTRRPDHVPCRRLELCQTKLGYS